MWIRGKRLINHEQINIQTIACVTYHTNFSNTFVLNQTSVICKWIYVGLNYYSYINPIDLCIGKSVLFS